MATAGAPGVASFHHGEFPAARLAAERELSVSVCLPARDEAATIGPILDALLPLRNAGVVDQVVVVDDSCDETASIAAARGAEVHRQADLHPGFGPVRGKGDAMWRALDVLSGDVVCFVDADTSDLGAHFVCGLVGPLLCGAPASFVKGFYRRPCDTGDGVPEADGGGRVTELCARPLLAAFYPDLAGVRQPLAGEIGARRELLESLPFTTGYGVDAGLLIDAWERCGPAGVAQVDLDRRQNRHRPLSELAPMAAAVADAVLGRLQRSGRLAGSPPGAPAAMGALTPPAVERPPAASLHPVPG